MLLKRKDRIYVMCFHFTRPVDRVFIWWQKINILGSVMKYIINQPFKVSTILLSSSGFSDVCEHTKEHKVSTGTVLTIDT